MRGVYHSSEKVYEIFENNGIFRDFLKNFSWKQKDFCQRCTRFLESDTPLAWKQWKTNQFSNSFLNEAEWFFKVWRYFFGVKSLLPSNDVPFWIVQVLVDCELKFCHRHHWPVSNRANMVWKKFQFYWPSNCFMVAPIVSWTTLRHLWWQSDQQIAREWTFIP